MPVEFECPKCANFVRADDDAAGSQIVCPRCDSSITVPGSRQQPPPLPVSPVLSGSRHRSNCPMCGTAIPMGSVECPACGESQPGRHPQLPHRGGLILVLSIAGLLICGFLGVVALNMGVNDLKEMREGRRDPAGRTLTRVGMTIAVTQLVLFAILVLFVILAAVLS